MHVYYLIHILQKLFSCAETIQRLRKINPTFPLLFTTKYLNALWWNLFEFGFFLRCVDCPYRVNQYTQRKQNFNVKRQSYKPLNSKDYIEKANGQKNVKCGLVSYRPHTTRAIWHLYAKNYPLTVFILWLLFWYFPLFPGILKTFHLLLFRHYLFSNL